MKKNIFQRRKVCSGSGVKLWLVVAVIVLPLLLTIEARSASEYINSAHGNSTTGANRDVGTKSPGTLGYSKGNCAHCHEMHASIEGVEPNVVGGPDRYLGYASEEILCQGCHDATSSYTTATPDDVKSDITRTYKHDLTLSSTAHKASETLADLDTTKHVECTDCHNPHWARGTTHTQGTNNIATTSPLYGVKGATPTTPAKWVAPTYTLADPATKEYEICYKCHSSNNDNLATWGGTGATAWTDVALEFNPNNTSYHPIVDTLNNGANVLTTNGAPKGLVAEQLLTPWSTNPGTNLMYCSDCHASDATAPFGPHGSTVKWMLRGATYTNWPFQTAANNGSSSATNWAYLDNGGTPDDTFCRECHPDTNATNSNNVHRDGNHKNSTAGRCMTCHIRVPHGGKVSRMVNAAVNSGDLPARYWPNGDGAGFTPEMHRFNKDTRSGYGSGNLNCSVRTCRGSHNIGSGESW